MSSQVFLDLFTHLGPSTLELHAEMAYAQAKSVKKVQHAPMSESSEQSCVRTDCGKLLLIILLGARENPAQQTLNAADYNTADTECSIQ